MSNFRQTLEISIEKAFLTMYFRDVIFLLKNSPSLFFWSIAEIGDSSKRRLFSDNWDDFFVEIPDLFDIVFGVYLFGKDWFSL